MQEAIEIAAREAPGAVPLSAEEDDWYSPRAAGTYGFGRSDGEFVVTDGKGHRLEPLPTQARAMQLSVLEAIAIAEARFPDRPTRAYRLSDDALTHDVLLVKDGTLLAVRVDSAGAVIDTRDVPSLEEFLDSDADEDDSWDPEETAENQEGVS